MKIMKISAVLITALVLIVTTYSSAAAEPDLNSAIKAKLLRIGLTAIKVEPSPLPGLLQVQTNRGLFYTSKDGKYFIAGRMFDIDAGMVNMTEKALANIRIDGVKEFKDSMIVFPAENEKYKITVFTDTTCGYCKKLHKEVEEYQQAGIEVKYIPYPRSALMDGEPAFGRLKQVMCAEDKRVAMTEIKEGTDNGAYVKESYADSCVDSIRKGQLAGRKVGLQGTPLMYLVGADIQIIPGYQAAENVISLFTNSRQ